MRLKQIVTDPTREWNLLATYPNHPQWDVVIERQKPFGNRYFRLESVKKIRLRRATNGGHALSYI